MQIDKDQVQAMYYFNKATSYLKKDRCEKAIQFFKKAVALFPAKEIYLNYANALTRFNRDEEATALTELASEYETPYFNRSLGVYPQAISNLGMLRYRAGDDLGAISLYTKALKLEPKYPDCVWNYSCALLRRCSSVKSTNWEMAWEAYKIRFQKFDNIKQVLSPWIPKTRCDTLVVLSEQGLGDKIQFARYIHLLKKYCDKVVVHAPHTLHPLFSEYECTEDLTPYIVSAKGVYFCDLAGIFGWDSAPANWINKEKFVPLELGTGLNIIVEGSGSKTHVNNHNRSCDPELLLEFSEFGNLYSFGKGYKSIVGLNTVPDWGKTASAVLGSDVLITVDTSVAHLCGSLDHPCILLQPLTETDWRWGDDSMEIHNIWYPTVFIIRNPGSWRATIEAAKTLIRDNLC